MASTTKRLIYQRARWHLPTTERLQAAYVRATRRISPDARAQPVSEDASETEGTWRKLTYNFTRGAVSCGKLAQYTHGAKQETVKQHIKPDDSPEGAASPPPGFEFQDGSLYFCMEGDHVVVAQSMSLRISQLEEYLNWLLREKARVVMPENFLLLESVAKQEAQRILELAPPKSVTFSRPVELRTPASGEKTMERHFAPTTKLKAIEELLGQGELRNFIPDDALQSGRLQTSLTLSWNQRTGGQQPEGALDGFGRIALRAIDEDPDVDVKVETRYGNLTREKLSLAQPRSFQLTDGRVHHGQVFEAMVKYLAELREEDQLVD
jgi:hypothetical protein